MKLLISILVGFKNSLISIPWMINLSFSFKEYEDMKKRINKEKVEKGKKEVKIPRGLFIFVGLIATIIVPPLTFYWCTKEHYKNPEEFYEEEYEEP